MRKLFNEIKCRGRVLNNLMPANNVDNRSYPLRDTYPYKMPIECVLIGCCVRLFGTVYSNDYNNNNIY